MKKAIIISSRTLTILCVLFFGFTSCDNTIKTDEAKLSNSKDLAFESSNMELPINKNIPDLYYGVDTRFAAIKKSDIDKATTIYDFLNEGEAEQIVIIPAD